MKKAPVRVIYSSDPGSVDSVKQNPDKIFLVVGPFESHCSDPKLQDAIELIVRGHNRENA